MSQSTDNNKPASLAKNISYNALISIISYLFSAFGLFYVSRVLQPEVYGRVEYADTVVRYFVLFAGLGMPVYALRACARCRDDKERLNRVYSELFTLGLVLALIGSAVLTVLCFTVPLFISYRSLLLIFGTTMLWKAVGCEWLYKGLERYRYLAIVTLVTRVISFVWIILAIHSPEDVNYYAVLSMISICGVGVINFCLLGKLVDHPFQLRFNWDHMKPLLIFFAMSCMSQIYGGLDVVMIRAFKGDYETGLYGLIHKGKILLAFFGSVIVSAVLPRVTAAWNRREQDRFRSIVKSSINLCCLINLSVMVFCVIYARDCVLLMGGEKYLAAVDTFRLTAISVAPIGLSNILSGLVMIPTGKELKLLLVDIVGAVVNLVLNFYAIPKYSFDGAAMTTLFTEALVMLLCLYFNSKIAGFRIRDMFPNFRIPLACAIAAVPAWFVRNVGSKVLYRLTIGAIVFFGVYGIAAYLMKESTVREGVKIVFGRLLGKKKRGEQAGDER